MPADIAAPRNGRSLSPLNQRRWNNFKRNRRAFWSLIIFAILFGLSLFAEFIANDKPILVQYQGELYAPIFSFYPETAFGGDFQTEAVYRDLEVQCLIASGGLEECFDDPEGVIDAGRRDRHGERAGDREGLGALAADPLQLSAPRWTAPVRPRCRPTARTGWAPTTPSAMCWRG